MTILAKDPTAAAILAAIPCYAVPPHGRSPALEALQDARTSHGLAVGKDGVMLILRRPWLVLDLPVTPPIAGYLPYGDMGMPRAALRCGLVPREHFEAIVDHFHGALPHEAAAFILWNEATGRFVTNFPEIEEATPARLVYRPPIIEPGWHLICDIHSHGRGAAYFSATDNADDMHATKLSLVLGRLGHPDGPVMAMRLCAAGLFIPLPCSPFEGDRHVI
ncbi:MULTISPECIES: PRTRC system protein A [Sphingobium]|jgi:PRTRC genetic system protein A|uniref:PRTRC system protein A n=1 Tax=Sphingobium TaxID=165695 RepID=UPI000DBADBFF|nr:MULTISPECIES: PRTRC system protein A [Sphingobium]BBD03386.1 hypothetical protein YGS_C2P1400 [Sphingobium sp. YG1]